MTLKPREERPNADTIVQQLRAQLTRIPGMKAYVQNIPRDPHRRPAHQEHRTSTLCRARTPTSCTSWAPKIETRSDAAGPGRRHQRPADRQAQVIVEIDRKRAAALGVSARTDREHALRRLRPAPGLDHLRADQQYWVVMELEPQLPERSVGPVAALCAVDTGELVPLNSGRALSQRVGPLAINHLGQLPAVTISFDLAPGVSHRRGNRRIDERDARCSCRRSITVSTRARRRHSSLGARAWVSCCCLRSS